MSIGIHRDESDPVPTGAFAEVAMGVPLDMTFHYSIPSALAGQVVVGRRVLVPFGKRKAAGWVVGRPEALPKDGFAGEIKDVLGALDDGPLLGPEELALYRWIADYYHHPLGLVLKSALPAGMAKDRVKPQTEKHYFAVPGMNDEVLLQRLGNKAPAQAEAFALLRKAGEGLSAPILRRTLGDRGAGAIAELVKKRLVRVREVEVMRSAFDEEPDSALAGAPASPPPLTPEQARALDQIEAALRGRRFAPMLLQGVTGSGKTEVYLRAIAIAREIGRTAIALVPEIALTPQLVGRFRARFGEGIAVLHSGLSEGQRFDEWRRIRRGEVGIAVGARSAVFAPLGDLGIVVVDEEHDGSYKQDEGLHYHARDVAVMRAKGSNAVALLGSATPSLETFQNAEAGRYGKLVLSSRVADRPMPPVELVGIAGGKRRGPISPRLHQALLETLAAKQQAILFLNRRGFAPSLVCNACGHVVKCDECSVAMIFHSPTLARKKKAPQGTLEFGGEPDLDAKLPPGWLTCHYCGRTRKPKARCPACDQEELRLLGVGTQRLEAELRELFPTARIARMDRDTTSQKGSHAKILGKLASGEIDILLGTQMIAKGLDFPAVTLVGVVLADTGLGLADFRAAERTFQLLTQVAGRAGRGETPGRVIVQSFHPDHYAIALAATHDFDGFAARELGVRQELFYPPFSRLVNLKIHGRDRAAVERAAGEVRERLAGLLRGREDVRFVGPAPAPLAMLRGRHRWQILLRAKSTALARWAAEQALPKDLGGDLRFELDVDPQSLL